MKYLIVKLICISLTICDAEHLSCGYWPFIHLLWRNVYSNPVGKEMEKIGFLVHCWWEFKMVCPWGNQMRVCEVSSVVSDSMQSSEPARLLCPWDCPGKNTRMGCHALPRGNLLTQGSNPHLLHLLHCSGFFPTEPLGKPRKWNTLKHTHTHKSGGWWIP